MTYHSLHGSAELL